VAQPAPARSNRRSLILVLAAALAGDERELRSLWTELQLLPSLDTGQDTLHSAPLRIYDREGVWVATLHAGTDLSEENLLRDIRTALDADGGASR
jgi:hypothetical protein